MEFTKPSVSGCTIRSDYSFDTSACWSAPPSEADTSEQVFTNEKTVADGSECDNLNGASFRTGTWQGDTAIICSFTQLYIESSWSQWSLTFLTSSWSSVSGAGPGSAGTSTLEVMRLPSSREKCLPGSTDCMYKYEGTCCPDGHTSISTAFQNSASTLFCCPFAKNLDSILQTVGSYGTVDVERSQTITWYDGPLVACVYSGGKVVDEVFDTAEILLDYNAPTYSAYWMRIKPISIELTGTPSLSFPTTNTNATPGSTPSSAGPSSTNTTLTDSSAGLSTPLKIGIGVGVSLGILFLLAITATMIFLRRLRRKRNPEDGTYHSKPELDGQPANKEIPMDVHEAQDDQVNELDGTTEPVEIERSRDIQEIEDTGLPAEADRRSNIPEMRVR
ncbi:hypothetical protein P171DRAFT_478752 [Karstenula rhodostoma CBS 690.94]|uniref:Mid2 domain-containing protein n=1 Tax=Karstenula rhodostoma CBS 690.94 TaxID=1392251 RepID=A0A9P4PZG9_9PLEO|nr:hypothetical protein P171DRAFT_478752 [Karstenula rhodostoma CBS 690.94]